MALPHELFDNLRLPAVAAPLFIISNPDLVIKQCTSGIVGSFPSLNARPQDMLGVWLSRITESLEEYDRNNPSAPAAPYAVNLIAHRSNDRLDADLATIVEFEVPIVITSLGARAEINDAIHAYGGMVLHDVIDNRFARKAIEKGADGLIAVAAGAGGHAGVQSPFALVQEIREWFQGPLLLSGAISRGRSILAAQAIGADLAYIGSAFIATEEANSGSQYKQMIVESIASDIVYSNLFTGVHGNYLRGSIESAGMDPERLAQSDPSAMDFGTGESGVDAASVKVWRDIWGAGQGVGSIHSVVPVAELIARLTDEYARATKDLLRLVEPA